MRVTTFGTRGSLPVAGKFCARYGGNTTSLRVESNCLPEGMVLAIDAGSGFQPLSQGALAGGMKEMVLLFTHYHYDHVQGLLIAPPIYIPNLPIHAYGPVQQDVGPNSTSVGPGEMLRLLMKPPFHPVDSGEVRSGTVPGGHFKPFGIKHPANQILLFHPKGGHKLWTVDKLDRVESSEAKQVPFKKAKFPLEECLVVRMHISRHPERTISYRFEERPTGKVFVFLTDEENRDGVSNALRAHLHNATLLIMDVQYTREEYDTRTSGFGHSSPDWAMKLARELGLSRVGFTHHDPKSSDDKIEAILQEGRDQAPECIEELFACGDGDVFKLM